MQDQPGLRNPVQESQGLRETVSTQQKPIQTITGFVLRKPMVVPSRIYPISNLSRVGPDECLIGKTRNNIGKA